MQTAPTARISIIKKMHRIIKTAAIKAESKAPTMSIGYNG